METPEKGKIITGACSVTYGHGLKDCIAKDGKNPGPQPSQYSYVSLLGKKLNQEVINLSTPGGSNERMLYELQTVNINPQDTVIILWSYFYRNAFYNQYGIANFHAYGGIEEYNKYLVNVSNDNDAQLKNLLNILYTTYYLESKGCKIMYGFLESFMEERLFKPYEEVFYKSLFHIEKYNCLDFYLFQAWGFQNEGVFPLAGDNSHPGEMFHEFLADHIYNLFPQSSPKII